MEKQLFVNRGVKFFLSVGRAFKRAWRSLCRKIKSYKGHPVSLVLFLAVLAAAALAVFFLFSIIIHIVVQGVPQLRLEMFAREYTSENQSMTPAIINTVMMVGLSLMFALPIGTFAAIYLSEYAKRGNKFVRCVRLAAETLSGIPSIVYGLFGMIVFNGFLNMGYSLISGALTMTLMILPLIMRTTEESILAVEDSLREGSFGLGAGKLRTLFKIVLPSAVPGILSGMILGVGRVIGETAALMFTAGTATGLCSGLSDSCSTLSLHMFMQINNGLFIDEAYATAFVLLVLVLLLNLTSSILAAKFSKGKK